MSGLRKQCQQLFIYLIFATIAFVFYVNMFVVYGEVVQRSVGSTLYQILFSVSAFFMVWALVKTMLTDPGKVPQNWGFFLNDPEQKKRRFCLICHIFKPERCHHCSACNRCVLNMDHHCPWINNCVGFYNRRFFLQMLLYVITTTFLGAFGLFYGVCLEVEQLYAFFKGHSDENILQTVVVLASMAICSIVFALISMFFKFHIELVLSNRTTIENLDKKRQEETGQIVKEVNQFDIGKEYNWYQVFGMNRIYWFLPIESDSGRPSGDGVLWPKKGGVEVKVEDVQSPSHNFTSPKTNDNSQVPLIYSNGSRDQQLMQPYSSQNQQYAIGGSQFINTNKNPRFQ